MLAIKLIIRATSKILEYHSRTRMIGVFIIILMFNNVFSQDLNSRFYPIHQSNLSDKFVWCIYKDSWGFIWFGTTNGLYRYNGTDVKLYKHNPRDSTSICHNSISDIIEDSDRNLWIGTAYGLALYNRENDSFIDINSIPQNDNALNNVFITSLGVDEKGNVWMGTRGGGINIYDPKAFHFSFLYNGNTKDDYKISDYVLNILVDGQQVWAATRAGLKVFHSSTLQPLSINYSNNNILTKEITDVIKGQDKNLWVSTIDGEIYELIKNNYLYETKNYGHLKNEDGTAAHIIQLVKNELNNLWVVTENAGMKFIDVSKRTLINYQLEEGNPYSIPGNEIRSIYVDNQGVVWFGSNCKGVYFIDNKQKKFELYQRNAFKTNTLQSNQVNAFARNNDKHIWIATDGGLNILEFKTRRLLTNNTIEQLDNKSVTSLIFDSQNKLWIGTRNNGVIRLNPESHETEVFNVMSSGTGNNKVLSIYEDKRKTIWVGTSGSGLFYFDSEKQRFISLCETDQKNYVPDRAIVTSIVEDSDSTIWVGTLYGLYTLKRNGPTQFTYMSYLHKDNKNLSSDRIQTIYEDAKGNVWLGTADSGLNLWVKAKNNFQSVQFKNDSTSYSIMGILDDRKGNLWISSDDGLLKFNPKSSLVKKYSKLDGLNSNNFSPNSCLRLSSGELVFGGNNGFNIFYPDSIKDNYNPPKMWLTDFKLNNQQVKIGSDDSPLIKHIGLTERISLSYDQRSFTIDFIGISYGSSSRNQYCYMLEGFDKNWNCIGQNHTAVYTNIDPGKYIFLAKGTNADGVWTEHPARLEITIHPPFWNTWWAILLYISVVGFVLYFISKIRMERLKMTNQINFEKMAREKEHELTLSKMQFFTNISHEIRTPLSLILIPIESLVSSVLLPKEVKKSMHVAYQNLMYLTRLINELMDFSKMDNSTLHLHVQNGELIKFITEVASSFEDMSAKRKINLTIEANLPSIQGWFDRGKIEKVILNILSNAFKFTPDNGQIRILILVSNDSNKEDLTTRFLKILIIDNGIGISSEELPHIFDKFFQAKSAYQTQSSGTGIGLSLSKELLQLHHGSITVESNAHNKTTFTITFPIDSHAYAENEMVNTPIDVVTESENLLFDEHTNNSEHNYEKPVVLIVEDNDELRNLLSAELLSEFTIIESIDGESGIHLALEQIPDLIISDIVMPQKTGLDLCAILKSDIRTSHIPIILLTAKTAIDDQVTGLEGGADIYITKPFSIRILKSHARQIITSRRKLYAHFSQDAYLLPTQLTNNEIDEEFLKKAIDFIIENILNDQLSVESIAEPLHLSKSQFYKKIKSLTGQTAVEFIRTIRLKHALKLMETKRYTLAEIAYQAGFSSPSYFTRSFKEQFGKPPSEYIRH